MAKKDIPPEIRKPRGSWGDIKPITRIIPNKKKNPKDKYKKWKEETNE